MANPSANEKIASGAGRIYVATVMPLMSGVGVAKGQLAHVQGFYAGIAYSTATLVSNQSDYIVSQRRRARG